jgi:hypothetical protein
LISGCTAANKTANASSMPVSTSKMIEVFPIASTLAQ